MIAMAVKMIRGNREKLVPFSEKEKYLKMGYSVIDESGKIIEQGSRTMRDLNDELAKKDEEIAVLKTELAKKDEEISALKEKKNARSKGQESKE